MDFKFGKSILIPSKLFIDIIKLLIELDDINYDSQVKKDIYNQIDVKLASMEKRKVFTGYKTGIPDSIERERARKKYLEIIGMHKDFISEEEIKTERINMDELLNDGER